MNKLTNSEIWELIEAEYKQLKKTLPDNLILGTFVIGKANFGCAEELKDLTLVSIIFPTLKGIVVNSGGLVSATYSKDNVRYETLNFTILFDLISGEEHFDYTQILFTEFFMVNPMFKKAFEKIQFGLNMTYEERKNACEHWAERESNLHALADQLTAIFKQCLELSNGLQDELFKALTKTEEKALIYILNTMGEEGNISISAAIAGSGISRPVFTSLFDKLDKYNGAEIKNQGVKGTYINFYDHVISRFEVV